MARIKKLLLILLIVPVFCSAQLDTPKMSAYPFLSGNPIGTWNWQLFGILQTGVNPNGTLKYVNRRFDVTSLLSRNYHTGTQPASTLTEDASHRFATDAEKTAWNNKQAALVSGTNIKTVNNQALTGPGNITITGGGFDTTNQQVYNAVKKIAQDNAVQVDYAVDGDYGFDRIDGKLYIKGMHFFPSVATAYGTVTLDPYSSNAAGKITFTSNGTAIPADGIICTVTFVTTTYAFTPFIHLYAVGSASAGQALYPAAESINSFQIRVKTGFSPSNGAVLYYGYRASQPSNVSGQ